MLSTVAHGDIKSVDTTDALAIPGVKGYISSADIPGNNEWDGELVFNDKTVGVFSFSITIIKSSDIRVPRSKRIGWIVDKIPYTDVFYFLEGLENDGCGGLVVQNLPFLQALNLKRLWSHFFYVQSANNIGVCISTRDLLS